jgi:hypothetical protein
MIEPSSLRLTKMPLNNGAGYMPAFGFRTLIPDTALTKTATRDRAKAVFRHFDCAERYWNGARSSDPRRFKLLPKRQCPTVQFPGENTGYGVTSDLDFKSYLSATARFDPDRQMVVSCGDANPEPYGRKALLVRMSPLVSRTRNPCVPWIVAMG